MTDKKPQDTLYSWISSTFPKGTDRSFVDLRYRTVLNYVQRQLYPQVRANERTKVLAELESWLVDTDCDCGYMHDEQGRCLNDTCRQSARCKFDCDGVQTWHECIVELRAKVQEMKGEK